MLLQRFYFLDNIVVDSRCVTYILYHFKNDLGVYF